MLQGWGEILSAQSKARSGKRFGHVPRRAKQIRLGRRPGSKSAGTRAALR